MPFFSAATVRTLMKKGLVIIEPWDDSLLHESGELSLTLSAEFRKVADQTLVGVIDTSDLSSVRFTDHTMDPHDGLVVHRGNFLLLKTQQRVTLAPTVSCLITTRPDFAQLGMDMTQTSLFVRGGSSCQIVLEMSHHGPIPIRLRPGCRAVKAIFAEVI